MAEAVIVVSGLPRSGTSLMMQMLHAGGVAVVSDGKRPADTANPRGYFEYGPVRRLKDDATWLPSLGGRALKIISPLLRYIPQPCPCKVILLERVLPEILLSQEMMLRNVAGEEDLEKLRQENEELLGIYEKHLESLPQLFAQRQDWEVLPLSYGSILKDPLQAARQLSSFLGRELDEGVMAKAVDPKLYRSRL